MANPYINIYMGNPTAGGTDGTAVSTGGLMTAPIAVTLEASQNEVKVVPLAIRTEQGYTTTGTVTISDNNDTNDRLKFCWTPDGTFADSITTAGAISSVNTLFYAQFTSSSLDTPVVDTSFSGKVSCVVVSAGA